MTSLRTRAQQELRAATAILVQPSSPRFPSGGAQRKIGIAVDLSDESSSTVRWAVQNYLRAGDAVVLVQASPTSVLYGADWGAVDATAVSDEDTQRKLEDDFDASTTAKGERDGGASGKSPDSYRIHIVKDHDMKERLCLAVERLGLGAVIMGSRAFGAAKRTTKGRLGSVSDYRVHHCVCPVIVVRSADNKNNKQRNADVKTSKAEFPEHQDYALNK